jgi:GNAT superfamily N-acetyltransferase
MDGLMSAPLKLRRACADDIPAMHTIRLQVSENRLSDPSLLTESDYLPFIDKQGETWVALIADQIAGFAAIDLTDQSVWALFVDPSHEGRGLGKQLMTSLIERARELGFSSLRLVTTPGTRAEAFYLRGGWEQVGIEANGECRLALALA